MARGERGCLHRVGLKILSVFQWCDEILREKAGQNAWVLASKHQSATRTAVAV